MNRKLYIENPNAARKGAFHEAYEKVQDVLKFYRDTTGFTKYYEYDRNKIMKSASEKWQDAMNMINANAIYYGEFSYDKILTYINTIKKLITNEEGKEYSMIVEWNEKYPALALCYEKLEENLTEDQLKDAFVDYFNELRIAANKEFMSLIF